MRELALDLAEGAEKWGESLALARARVRHVQSCRLTNRPAQGGRLIRASLGSLALDSITGGYAGRRVYKAGHRLP